MTVGGVLGRRHGVAVAADGCFLHVHGHDSVTERGIAPLVTMRYDIRDAILTCAQKPTRVSFIYRTEPTTKKWKTETLKSKKKRMCSELSVNSPRNPCSQS